jgi:hypothetical protein
LLFESTRNFLQSAIRTVIPLLQKIPCESKALRDHPAPGEKCGLVISCLERFVLPAPSLGLYLEILTTRESQE